MDDELLALQMHKEALQNPRRDRDLAERRKGVVAHGTQTAYPQADRARRSVDDDSARSRKGTPRRSQTWDSPNSGDRRGSWRGSLPRLHRGSIDASARASIIESEDEWEEVRGQSTTPRGSVTLFTSYPFLFVVRGEPYYLLCDKVIHYFSFC